MRNGRHSLVSTSYPTETAAVARSYFETSPIHKEEENRMKNKTHPVKKALFWFGIIFACIAAYFVIFSGGDIFLPVTPPNQGEDIESFVERVLSSEGAKLWKKQCTLLQEEAFSLVDEKCRQYKAIAASSSRLGEFADEYFGYFKGMKFLFLGAMDLTVTDGWIQEEIRDMLLEYIFFDYMEFHGEMQYALERLAEKHVSDYAEAVLGVLEQRFTRDQIETVLKSMNTKGISITASNLHTVAIFAVAPLISGKIGTSLLATQAGEKIAAIVVSRLPALSGTLATTIGTFGISILVDYLCSRGVKMLMEEDLKESLRRAVSGFVDDSGTAMKRALVGAIGELSRAK